jgi:type IV secretion system protein VirB6
VNQWHLFQFVFERADLPIQQGVQAMVGALSGYFHGPLLLIVSVYLAGMTAVELYRPDGNIGMNTVRRLFRAALVVAVVLNVGTYNQYVTGFFFDTIPTEISNAVSAVTPQDVPVKAAAFDSLLDNSIAASVRVYKAAPSLSLRGLFIMFIAAAYLIWAAIALAVAFLVWIVSHIFLALLIATGPAFVVLFLFPRTEPFFNGWINAVVAVIITQVFVVALLAFSLLVEMAIIHQAEATLKGGASEQAINALMILVESGLVYTIITLLVVQVPGFAGRIAGGVAHNITPYVAAAQRAFSGAVQRTGGGGSMAAGAAPRGTQSAIRRNLVPPGRAL